MLKFLRKKPKDDKKFEVTRISMCIHDDYVYRIRALKTFRCCNGIIVGKGEFGGYVTSESNLSQTDNSWIFDDSVAKDNSVVMGDSVLTDGSIVDTSVMVTGVSRLNNTVVGNSATLENATLQNTVVLSGFVKSSTIEDAHMIKKSKIINSVVDSNCFILKSEVDGVFVSSNVQLNECVVKEQGDYILIHKWWQSHHPYITWCRSNNKLVDNYLGIFNTVDELIGKYIGTENQSLSVRYAELGAYLGNVKKNLESPLQVKEKNDIFGDFHKWLNSVSDKELEDALDEVEKEIKRGDEKIFQ